MSYQVDDTIVALASAPGPSLRGILRLSGPQAIPCATKCFRTAVPHSSPGVLSAAPLSSPPVLRGGKGGCSASNTPTNTNSSGANLTALHRPSIVSGWLDLPRPLGPIECDLHIWPTNRSYTRQPIVEIHTFGSPPLLESALRQLCACGARLAEPGEFTLRAFLAGRLDLTQAEAVLGVIDARDRAELDVALSQLAGGLATPLHTLRGMLLDLLAQLEAGLDFVEEDIEFISQRDLVRQLARAAREVAGIRSRLVSREVSDSPRRVVLAGWPNVGKSTLFNALVGEAAALVSHEPGTTRDYVTGAITIDGRELVLIDTAGFDQGAAGRGYVAIESQNRRAAQSSHADLQLLCLDCTRPLNAWEQEQLADATAAPRLVVWTKADAAPTEPQPASGILTSGRTGDGVDSLRRAIRDQLDSLPGREHLAVASTAARCRESLRQASASLRRARRLAHSDGGQELIAAEVRLALDELGKVVGAVCTDDILERVFSRFCIGK